MGQKKLVISMVPIWKAELHVTAINQKFTGKFDIGKLYLLNPIISFYINSLFGLLHKKNHLNLQFIE